MIPSNRLCSANVLRRRHRPHRLNVEPLEDRRLLAVSIVNTEFDVVDATDDLTSLREAILEANATTGADSIAFDFGHDGPAVIRLELGELEITEAVTVTGDGPELLTIDAQQQARIFNISATVGDFAFAGMTLANGKLDGDNESFNDHTYDGGAIRSLTTGILTVENSDIVNNSTSGRFASGGGLLAIGPLIVRSSAIVGNSAHEGGDNRRRLRRRHLD